MRVILDANVVVSFLLTHSPTISAVIRAWRNNEFLLLVSDEILIEYKQILVRIAKNGLVQSVHSNSLFEEILKEGLTVQVNSTTDVSKDRKDNRYLSCAKDGKAEYLVTGDKKHLLKLKVFEKTRIVSPKEFVEVLEKK